MRHLRDQGHERIAFVGGPRSIPQVADRLRGARRVIAADDLPAGALHVVETEGLNAGAGRAAGEIVAAMPPARRPTAVFCANDLLALGVLQEMTRRRIEVPDEVAIVGYDDIEFASAAAVPLTSVRQPRHELGVAAARLLLEEAQDRPRHRHRQVVFEPELVVRTSTHRLRPAASGEVGA